MARKLWLGIALAVAAGAAITLLWPGSPPAATAVEAPASPAAAKPVSAPLAPPEPVSANGAPSPDATSRRKAGYDRYRAELRRIRAAREQAQALQANERCIGGQRYRKDGTEWRQAGGC